MTSLEAGAEVEGPAIVLEETATTYVDAGYVARVDESACLFVRNERVSAGADGLPGRPQRGAPAR